MNLTCACDVVGCAGVGVASLAFADGCECDRIMRADGIGITATIVDQTRIYTAHDGETTIDQLEVELTFADDAGV